jgi:hypothetical protein
MAYDLHIVRTDDWFDSAANPVSKPDVDELIQSDPELARSTVDYVDMGADDGGVTRYFYILWNGNPCFWWYRDEITCAGPNENQTQKMVEMARALGAKVLGDDGEAYQ